MHTLFSDTELIQLVLEGKQSVYADLVDRYRAFVFTIVLRYINSREDAEEVSQDIFVKAYKSLADFKGASKFSTWLYTITTTTCLSFLRKKKLDVQSLDNERVFATAEALNSSHGANPMEQKSRVQMVDNAMKMLSSDDAQVLTLFYKAEQNLDEIAQILNKEPNAVKVQLHRARGRLKEKLTSYFSAEVNDL